MKKSIFLCLAIGFAAVAARGVLRAQVPESASPAGRVLVLDNENVLEGKVERLGDLYIITQDGGELRLPANRALMVCAGLPEAYKFLAQRINARDADEHLRLARWCQARGLLTEARFEASTALTLRPGHNSARQMLAMLEKNETLPSPVPRADPPRAAIEAPAPVEINAECLATFSTQVQPILLNTCASCHASGKSESFVLTRMVDSLGRRATQMNLAAAIAQIDFEHPAASPLLLKAVAVHGGATQAPLPPNLATALANLQQWVVVTVAEHPHLRSHGARPAVSPAVTTAQPVQRIESPRPEAPTANIVPIGSGAAPLESGPTEPAAARVVGITSNIENAKTRNPAQGPVAGEFRPVAMQEPPAQAFQPADPFDAAIFNRLEKTVPQQ